MTKSHSSRPAPQSKPAKPRPDFPLFPHATGRWAKKIRGRLVYFGKWNDPDGALAKYLEEKEALHSGLTPADTSAGLTMFLLCGQFLTAKKNRLNNGELSIHSFNEYAATCKRLLKTFGRTRLVSSLRPADFERLRAKIAKRWGLVRLGNEVIRVRTVMKWAHTSAGLEQPVRFGDDFRRPPKSIMRKHRKAQGSKMFEAEEIRRMLEAAGQPLKAMILLGINAGFGNSDLGTLPLVAVDLERGWIDHARPKTGIDRRCPLWPETVAALKEWLPMRPTAKNTDHAGLVFITARGGAWAKDISDSPITKETRKLLDKLKIDGHRNFYCLRHTFQTIGDNARDFIAVRKIMGHASSGDREDIADAYRERVDDQRLQAVAEHVRGWLFKVTE